MRSGYLNPEEANFASAIYILISNVVEQKQ